MKTFPELPQNLSRAMEVIGFKTPTDIQDQVIPIALQGKNVLGIAQTGTGKTAAFAIPVLAQILLDKNKRALILAPTRELAQQIFDVVYKLTKFTPEIRTTLVVGGASMFQQVRALQRKPNVVIATPGRTIDHVTRKTMALTNFNIVVLDEVDRMLDIGFAPQLRRIFQFLPKQRQSLFFSATVPKEIRNLVQQFATQVEEIKVGEAAPVAFIAQAVKKTSSQEKNQVLVDELNEREGSVIIFARTQRRTDKLSQYLVKYGYSVTHIHGGRSLAQRRSALQGFRNGAFRILVSTDVTSRGIDISHVAHVINYDIPEVPEDYVHRIGRTARAGATGKALSLLAPEDRRNWKDIERLLAKFQALPQV